MNDRDGNKPFTGRTGKRTTGRNVIIADLVARFLISSGGIATIAAVLGICFFLVWVVLPLLLSAEAQSPSNVKGDWIDNELLDVVMDEYQVMGWALTRGGLLRVFSLNEGATLVEKPLFKDRVPTCSSIANRSPDVAIGFEDGTVDLLRIAFETAFAEADAIPIKIKEELAAGKSGSALPFREGMIQLTPEGQYRIQELRIERMASRKVSDQPVRLIDLVKRESGPLICTISGDAGRVRFKALSGSEKEDFFTGETAFSLDPPLDLPFEPVGQGLPAFLEIAGNGNHAYVAWRDGNIFRMRMNRLSDAFIAEKGRMSPEGVETTSMGFALGENTLIWGDSEGGIFGGFPVRIPQWEGPGLYDAERDETRSDFAFTVAKDFGRFDAPMTSVTASRRSRLMAAGFADGAVRLFNTTHTKELLKVQMGKREPVSLIALSPREDGILGITKSEALMWGIDPGYSEVSLSSLFLPVWYEGYAKPLHMWQSTGGTDEFEPKLGLIPLIFGTLKAALYAMLFGAPLALLAAIFSSEFIHPEARAVIKPMIELMASLPSVVLGFIGALVLAPYVEKMLSSFLWLFAAVPLALGFGACLWQLLAGNLRRRLNKWRMPIMVIPITSGILLSLLLGPWTESLFFNHDLIGWLAVDPTAIAGTPESSAIGGWMLLCFPICSLVSILFLFPYTASWMQRLFPTANPFRSAALDMARFVMNVLLTAGVALLVSHFLSVIGLDPRQDWILGGVDFSPLDVYVQRNALIVGIVMGFAVIPIVYTLADDALTAVPDHLRSASLGSGATQWQTTRRIVIPAAMSGLFSAITIGLGRAVGETMIVLMALGNTAVMDLNLFNGARTLSANIAVELPEAVRNSAHYRTLFLAALVLFAMTLFINTITEIIRRRFRRRFQQL
ncbi:MAG: ABC transporter permease subunit [Planctomycetota bacterium]